MAPQTSETEADDVQRRLDIALGKLLTEKRKDVCYVLVNCAIILSARLWRLRHGIDNEGYAVPTPDGGA